MRILSTVSLFCCFCCSASAFAQQSDEIIITTQKREQFIQDVPLSVTAYSSDELEGFSIEQFDDLASFIPGLEVQEQSANNPGFVIRGITSDSGEATIEPRVSIYQDGVSISRSRGSFIEIFDSQVEVVRGPQPTLFGRSALIGAISLNSNAPVLDEHSTRLGMGFGNLGAINLEAVANIPVVNDRAALRAAIRYKKREGYTENLLGPNLNDYETLAGRLSAKLIPNDNLDVSVIANFQTDNNSGTSFKSGTFFPAPGVSISPFSPAAIGSFDGLHGNRDLGLERDIFSITSNINYVINNNLSVSSVTSFRDFESYEVFDPDGFGYNLFSFAEIAQGEQLSQELRLNFSSNSKFNGFLGAAYIDESGFQKLSLGIGENIAQALLGGFLFTAPPGVAQNPIPLSLIPDVNVNPNSALIGASLGTHLEEVTNFGDTESLEFFADASYAITDKFEITGGARYTRDEKNSGYSVDADRVSRLTGVGLLLGTGIISEGRLAQQRQDFDGLSWRLAGHYQINDNIVLFANTAKGRRPEVISYNFDANDLSVLQTGTLPNRFEILKAETVKSYEVGIKGEFLAGRLQTDISSYLYDYANFQSTVIDNETGQSRPVNAGNASALGIESYVRFHPSANFDLFSLYAFTEATFDQTDDSGKRQEFAGNRFRLTPEHALTIGAKYTLKFGEDELVILPIYSWKSDVFFNNDNDRVDGIIDEFQPSYGLLDTKVTYLPKDKNWEIEIFAKNITNKNYLLDAGNVGGIFGIPTFIAAPPRTYGVELSYDF